jgi:hypothetical protein
VIANAAFVAAMILLLLTLWLMGQLAFLAPFKHVLLERYGGLALAAAGVVFRNLFAWCYAVNRWLFLKDTGRKLAHVERQLHTGDTIARDLSARLAQDD